jgi:serine/threonine-protein kinase
VAIFLVAKSNQNSGSTSIATTDTATGTTVSSIQPVSNDASKPIKEKERGVDTVYVEGRSVDGGRQTTSEQQNEQQTSGDEGNSQSGQQDDPPLRTGAHYVVTSSKAYFHNQPDADTRRDAYLTPSDEVMTAIDEQGDYVYIVFTNNQGQTSKGWVLKSDLRPAQ